MSGDKHPTNRTVTMASKTEVTACMVGMWSSATAALSTLAFGILCCIGTTSATATTSSGVHYWCLFSCMPLAYSYLFMTLANKYCGKITNMLFADCAIAFAIMYCTCNTLVYYVNITYVRLAKDNTTDATLAVIQQPPPSAFFSIEILGYTYLGISAIFLAYSIANVSNSLLLLVWIHGISAIVGFVIPLLEFVYEPQNENDPFYVFILLIWCTIFIPICFLFGLHFQRQLQSYAINEHNVKKVE